VGTPFFRQSPTQNVRGDAAELPGYAWIPQPEDDGTVVAIFTVSDKGLISVYRNNNSRQEVLDITKQPKYPTTAILDLATITIVAYEGENGETRSGSWIGAGGGQRMVS
jgi:hypothetical protein